MRLILANFFFPVKRKKSKKLSLITIGSLNPNKGHSFLLKAIKNLLKYVIMRLNSIL